jgi:hypothetical protein
MLLLPLERIQPHYELFHDFMERDSQRMYWMSRLWLLGRYLAQY